MINLFFFLQIFPYSIEIFLFLSNVKRRLRSRKRHIKRRLTKNFNNHPLCSFLIYISLHTRFEDTSQFACRNYFLGFSISARGAILNYDFTVSINKYVTGPKTNNIGDRQRLQFYIP